jgi:aromatic ring-opening dioxygenase catalytic subunit (LigB family)
MEQYMRGLGELSPARPTAILVVSAHWEAEEPTVMSAPQPPMLYDYYNFPPESYEVQWPAPGAPEVAGEVRSLLDAAGFRTREDPERGFDHGTFVPLKLAYPRAEVPTLQLSLRTGLDPAEHLRMGHALQPLRERGVLLVGSGMSYHNMRGLMAGVRGDPRTEADSRTFDEWLRETASLDASAREQRLTAWEQAPAARESHPREEHLLPLHVIAGAAGDDRASIPYRDRVMGAHVCAIHFG